MKSCPKCKNGVLESSNIQGKQVIVCHRCKTIFGEDTNHNSDIVNMEQCNQCGSFYFKQSSDTICCDAQELKEKKVIENV